MRRPFTLFSCGGLLDARFEGLLELRAGTPARGGGPSLPNKNNAGRPTSPLERVSRFTPPDANVIDPASELLPVDDALYFAGDHNGGDVRFGTYGHHRERFVRGQPKQSRYNCHRESDLSRTHGEVRTSGARRACHRPHRWTRNYSTISDFGGHNDFGHQRQDSL